MEKHFLKALSMTFAFGLVLWQILYSVLAMAHNFLFVLFLFCLIRLFIGKFHPFSALVVGLYTFSNALYGGCPLLEVQNFVARHGDAPLSVIGLAYEPFGVGEYFIRIVLAGVSILLVYQAYIDWNKPINRFNWPSLINPKTLTS